VPEVWGVEGATFAPPCYCNSLALLVSMPCGIFVMIRHLRMCCIARKRLNARAQLKSKLPKGRRNQQVRHFCGSPSGRSHFVINRLGWGLFPRKTASPNLPHSPKNKEPPDRNADRLRGYGAALPVPPARPTLGSGPSESARSRISPSPFHPKNKRPTPIPQSKSRRPHATFTSGGASPLFFEIRISFALRIARHRCPAIPATNPK
jgi:hypothetical protein